MANESTSNLLTQLLKQLNDVNLSLIRASETMAELLLRGVSHSDTSGVTTTELRSVGHRLVSSGGDLTDLGVKMGVSADQLDQQSQSS
jgi:hypothetical protein